LLTFVQLLLVTASYLVIYSSWVGDYV